MKEGGIQAGQRARALAGKITPARRERMKTARRELSQAIAADKDNEYADALAHYGKAIH